MVTALASLPICLRGRYAKQLVVAGADMYLFKEYPSASDQLARLAEVAASAVYRTFDPEHSLEVREYEFDGIRGTIQPFLSPFKPLSSAEEFDKNRRIAIARRQVLDWIVSNHDNHLNHVLVHDEHLAFVDYGQAFKYFPGDELSWDYHPNRVVGQLPPVHNELGPPERELPSEVEEIIYRVQRGGYQVVLDELEPYVKARCRTMTDLSQFRRRMRRRIERLREDFDRLYSMGSQC